MSIPTELIQAAELAKKNGPQQITARKLLAWYGFARRGTNKIALIRKDLGKLGVKTEPDYESVSMDVPIGMQFAKEEKTEPGKTGEKDKPIREEVIPTPRTKTAEVAPSHRISRLKAANTRPVSVKPTDKLETAVTLMMQHEFSQLPVMTSERDVKGMVSWGSIGNLLTMGKKCENVKDFMEASCLMRSRTHSPMTIGRTPQIRKAVEFAFHLRPDLDHLTGTTPCHMIAQRPQSPDLAL